MTELGRMLRAEGIGDSDSDRLAEFGGLLLDATRSINLTGARSNAALLPHLLDSLTLVPYVAGSLVDVGSGGGLPAIPVALITGVPITLVEATAKKARFLSEALRRFELPGEVICERAELAGRRAELRDRFSCGSTRAIGAITVAAELLMSFLEPGGLGLLQRGKVSEDERDALVDAALVLGGRLEAIEDIASGRRICLVRKLAATPQRFPRRTGIPSKRPLCVKPAPMRGSLGTAATERDLFNEKH